MKERRKLHPFCDILMQLLCHFYIFEDRLVRQIFRMVNVYLILYNYGYLNNISKFINQFIPVI